MRFSSKWPSLRLTRLWRRVHPDLFQRNPSAQAVNERSMQELLSYLDKAAHQQDAVDSGSGTDVGRPESCALIFFVSGESGLRKIDLRWKPSLSWPLAQQFKESAHGLVAALLQRIDKVDDPAETVLPNELASGLLQEMHRGPGTVLDAAERARDRGSRCAPGPSSFSPQRG